MKLKQMGLLLLSSSLALVACDSCERGAESSSSSSDETVAVPENTSESSSSEADMAQPTEQAETPDMAAPAMDGEAGSDEAAMQHQEPADEGMPPAEGTENQTPPADMPAPEGTGN